MKNLELNDKALDDVRRTVVYKRFKLYFIDITMYLNKEKLKNYYKK